ncbi:Uncharacterized protein APZ42_033451 [Daphnia magna]|uniref:RNA-directed DNA polymerase from mobile element jockey n=1 Tax=Daphnia magna TaxID=35525 RepID=A0A164L315_9CRUS|nr:Uncharacterized protein APZ42_033451 [Daphnia magna]
MTSQSDKFGMKSSSSGSGEPGGVGCSASVERGHGSYGRKENLLGFDGVTAIVKKRQRCYKVEKKTKKQNCQFSCHSSPDSNCCMVAETENTHTGPARVRQPASTHVPESRPVEKWPTTSNNHNARTTVSLPPVILKLIDGKANFRQMEMTELKAIIHDITLQVDKLKRSDSPRGGDLFVYPTYVAQRQALLKITHAVNRSIRAEQLNSINSHKRIIHRVPTSESETDLLELFASQGVTKIEHFTKLAEGTRGPAGTVALSLHRPLPARVTLVALSFSVFKTSPYIEVVGISINVTGYGKIDIISVYCPHGDYTKKEITQLLGSSNTNKTLVDGDLNGHHESWSSNQRPNRKSIYSTLLKTPEFTLITPLKLASHDLLSQFGETITDPKAKVKLFLKTFFDCPDSHGIVYRPHEEQIKEAMSSTNPSPLNKPITTKEIESGLSRLKSNATGLDLIHNKMLANLNYENREYINLTFNALLLHGVSPPEWKQAADIPILKPNKQLQDPVSYRPISLTSCLGRVMERIIKNILSWHLETNFLLQPSQAGFRPGRSTTDHLVALKNAVKTAFSKGRPTYAVFLDIAKAFDRTLSEGVLFKLSTLVIRGQILKWIQPLLTGRYIRVKIGNFLSPAVPVNRGVPQGAVLSPLLFNVMMSDLPLPLSGTHTLHYADDVTIYAQAKSPTDGEKLLQPYLDKLNRWGIVTSCLKMRNLFTVLKQQKYGPNTHTLATPFKTFVRSKIHYGMIAYGRASSTNIAKVDIVSRGIPRLILGAFKSTLVEILYADLGLELRDSCPRPTSFQSPSRLHQAKKNTPPWAIPPHSTSYFTMKKSAATQNETKARALFNSFAHQLQQSTIKAFSDGSVTCSHTSCAYTIPEKKTEGACFLTPGSNIQTAELYGILKTLEACYHLEPGPPKLYVFVDSQSALMGINATPKQIYNPVINDIWYLLNSLKDSGTHTHISWIPSHVGILGNEQPDKLTNNQSNIPATNRIDNSLSAPEIIQKYRRKWLANTLFELKTSGKPCIYFRTKLGIIEWHHHPIRAISIALHRHATTN